jgi:hypothetical protein
MNVDAVWIQNRPHDPGAHSQLQFSLAKRGIHVVNPRYPEGLVEFSAFRSGEPVFNILISPTPVDYAGVELHPLFLSGTGGELERNDLILAKTIRGEGRTWYIYTVE